MKKRTGGRKWYCPVCGQPNIAIKGQKPRCVGCGFVVEEFGKGPGIKTPRPARTETRRIKQKTGADRDIGICIGVIGLAVLAALLVIARGNLWPNSPEGVVLRVSDMPTGWRVSSATNEWETVAGILGLESAYVRVFTPENKSSPTVTSIAVKFKSSTASSSFFHSMKQLYGYSEVYSNIGDASYIDNTGRMGFFRKKDFFVMLEISAGNIENTGLGDIAYYLRICEGRTYWPWYK